jgi:hypothetical protein
VGKGRLKYGKPDANQKGIVDDLRKLGFVTVQDLKSVGEGCPDLLIGIGGKNYLAEVKDGSLPPSKQKLRDTQIKWHRNWRGSVHVLTSREQAVDWAMSMRGKGVENVPIEGVVLPNGNVLK